MAAPPGRDTEPVREFGSWTADLERMAAWLKSCGIETVAMVDEAHDTLSGPATQKILYREFHEFAEAKFESFSEISIAHIYNLRKRREYRGRRMNLEKTRPTQVPIRERRRPTLEGRAGYLRIDTVHQGDLEGMKGEYHINAVDEVTQWQVVGATQKISEAWLNQCWKRCWNSFPFRSAASTPVTKASSSTIPLRVF